MSTNCKRGTGSCANCHQRYSNRYKPEKCSKCNALIGGSYIPKQKKSKSSIPHAVQIAENIFSVLTTYRNDRCFVSRSVNGSWICLHDSCKEKRAMFFNSGKLYQFRCEHTDKASDIPHPALAYIYISEARLTAYPCSVDVKEQISLAISELTSFANAPVVKVSENCYAVYARTTASNPLGFCHVKATQTNGRFVCNGKDCRGFMSKAKHGKVKAMCIHLHILCCALSLESNSSDDEKVEDVIMAMDSSAPSSGRVTEEELTHDNKSNLQTLPRESTLTLAMKRKIPYKVGREVLQKIKRMDANSTLNNGSGWPVQYAPEYENCQLCDGPLSSLASHPGQKGKSYLLTEMNPFKSIDIKVKNCLNNECMAMNQSLPFSVGLLNISDKIMISFDILLEMREFFKTGHPLTNVISAKLNVLRMKSDVVNKPTDQEIKYIEDLLYNGYMGFEMMTDRDSDNVICGICGICPEVCLGDGNEKNCCSNAQIIYTKDDEAKKDLLSPEVLLDKIKKRAMEKIVYTRNQMPFSIALEELPPLIPMAARADKIWNTEAEKKSASLKTSQFNGDPAILHQLVVDGKVDIENLKELHVNEVTDICTKCQIPTQRRSKEALIGDIYALYSSILVGLSPCHTFSKYGPGKTGGFYHFVCRHGCTVASKFITLTESVRDAADIYLSLKYPPIVFINDTPCGLVRHLECRCVETAKKFWNDRCGCFEKPTLNMDPHENHNIPSIVPPEYKANGSSYAEEMPSGYEHPTSGTADRYILGDRFHSSTNPHKSPLCRYHDINLCDQANALSTSIQESQNQRKNIRRLRSTCHQNFETHILFNYLMDFYQNEQIVESQKKNLQAIAKKEQQLVRDEMSRLVLR